MERTIIQLYRNEYIETKNIINSSTQHYKANILNTINKNINLENIDRFDGLMLFIHREYINEQKKYLKKMTIMENKYSHIIKKLIDIIGKYKLSDNYICGVLCKNNYDYDNFKNIVISELDKIINTIKFNQLSLSP